MPFELTWEPRGVHRRYFGDVTIEERERSFDLICGDPRFDGLRYAITNYLEVVSYEVTPQATEEIAARHIAPLVTNPHIIMAAVVVDATIVEAIRHFISLNFITQPYRSFATEREARAWIEGFVPASPPWALPGARR
jgi:hypothetical protein